MKLFNVFKKHTRAIQQISSHSAALELQALMLGKLHSNLNQIKPQIKSLSEVEFKVFSQWGDDGIIQWLIHHLDIPNKTFIEFGVENFWESNTRFLMMNDNWSGFVMDGSDSNVARIRASEFYWKYDLTAQAVFIDAENINALLSSSNFDKEVGLLHIDLDGNDYWIWEQINVISPIIAIIEYNSVFGIDRCITVPYQKDFIRTKAHYSNLYAGASLGALHQLSLKKGYAFIGCNYAGNNAYFVRRDKLNASVREIGLEEGYVLSEFRESRGEDGSHTWLAGGDRLKAIQGMPVVNTETNELENL